MSRFISFLIVLIIIQNNCFGQTKKILILGMDGCRGDALQMANTPNIDALMTNAVYTFDALTVAPTWSGTGWSSMLTGVWPDKHGVTDNSFSGQNFEAYPHFITRIETGYPELNTASIAYWNPINDNILGNNADYNLNVDQDYQVRDAGVNHLLNENPDILFLGFDDIDAAGHGNGFSPDIEAYLEAIMLTDEYIGNVLTALYARPTYNDEDWLILLAPDHGGTPGGHGGTSFSERNVYLICSNENFTAHEITKSSETLEISQSISIENGNYGLLNFGDDIPFDDDMDFTIEIRVQIDDWTGDPAIISNKDWASGMNPGFVMSCTFPEGPEWKVNIADGNSRVDLTGSNIEDGQAHLLTATFDRDGLMSIYEDGNFTGSVSMAGIGSVITDLATAIGQDGTLSYVSGFTGNIQEIRIWSEALSEEVVKLNACKTGLANLSQTESLVHYYQLDQALDTYVNEISVSNALTFTNMPTLNEEIFVQQCEDLSNTPRIVDVAVTALDYLCIPVEASWELDGKSLLPDHCTSFPIMNASVALEGYFGADNLLNTSMNQNGILPMEQPFNIEPFNYSGNEVLEIDDNSVVDWALLELRDSDNPETVVARRAAIIYNDFSIRMPDTGSTDLQWNVVPDEYFFIVRHRSHLAIRSKVPISLYPMQEIDFTASASAAFGTEQLKEIADGLYGMYTGDFDGNGVVNTEDFNLWRVNSAAVNVYLNQDADGNGVVNVTDFNLWFQNRSKVGAVE